MLSLGNLSCHTYFLLRTWCEELMRHRLTMESKGLDGKRWKGMSNWLFFLMFLSCSLVLRTWRKDFIRWEIDVVVGEKNRRAWLKRWRGMSYCFFCFNIARVLSSVPFWLFLLLLTSYWDCWRRQTGMVAKKRLDWEDGNEGVIVVRVHVARVVSSTPFWLPYYSHFLLKLVKTTACNICRRCCGIFPCFVLFSFFFSLYKIALSDNLW